ncbi:hypothetical protein INS49_014856 [Diaporthe citri]|uniref:uncharacterized protein n=1 Tax=Diaporthe citri TaxID=83186 RepID=UPI001C814639|nr:uncharacterized protein INS49_014856 [Diaporthe citri]KAG6356980.1 hypothetical protein INS49_014856 [Diaporthe citri]
MSYSMIVGLLSPVVDTAQGPTDPEFFQYRSPPLNDQEQNICNSQKIRSSTHTSFSCFGLYFTFTTGVLIIITSYILEPILNRLHKRRQHKSYAHLEWISNNSLQLHRMAHEQLMGQKWANCADDIPTTDPELSLANLDISNPEHPVLRRPEAPKGNTKTVEPRLVAADPSSPTGASLHSDSAVPLSGRSSTSTTTSASDGSWGHNAQTAIMNVSGQLTIEEADDADATRDTMDSADIGGQAETAS